MTSELSRSRFALGAAFFVLCALSYLSVSAPVPTLLSPYPGAQFLLITTGTPRPLSMLIVPLLFLVCNAIHVIRPYRGRLGYLAWLAAPLTLLSIVYVALRAADGNAHQGLTYVIGTIAINGLMLMAFWAGWIAFARHRTSYNAVILSFVLFAWLSWLAFPYFGEGI